MSEYTLRITCEFCAGHRLWGLDVQCEFPHGHNFTAEVFLTSSQIGKSGMIIDFDDIKSAVRTWIMKNWDHAFLVNTDDAEMTSLLRGLTKVKLYTLQGRNPTAEALAQELFEALQQTNMLQGQVSAVRIWENPTQYAEYRA